MLGWRGGKQVASFVERKNGPPSRPVGRPLSRAPAVHAKLHALRKVGPAARTTLFLDKPRRVHKSAARAPLRRRLG